MNGLRGALSGGHFWITARIVTRCSGPMDDTAMLHDDVPWLRLFMSLIDKLGEPSVHTGVYCMCAAAALRCFRGHRHHSCVQNFKLTNNVHRTTERL